MPNESRNPRLGTLLERIAIALEALSATTGDPFDNDNATANPQKPRPGLGSKFLKANDAAEYLGISVQSLYGIVERRHLRPLRGPKRTYRFTQEMLDDYLTGKASKK